MGVLRAEDALDNPVSSIQSGSLDSIDLTTPPVDISEDVDIGFDELLKFSFPETAKGESISQIGQVEYVGDAICKITGIDDARVEDVVNVMTADGIQTALILGIDRGLIEAVVMGDYSRIKRGDQALSTGERLSIPVGDGLLGRVVSPLGEPLDGKGELPFEVKRPIEYPGPSIMMREPIYEPLQTGIMVIDTTIPVGLGQRELVIGDRKTGKSRTVLDAIAYQKGKDMYCVYVGVGMQAAKAKEALNLLNEKDAMGFTTIVMSFSDDPPTLQYIAPYAGVAVAEHLMYQGKHVLVVYDDLSKQAKAYRQVSLLLKRSPGRDAYPGDIFFLHSRLLERSAKLHTKLGAGSITAMPVAQTVAGDVSEYIITNLMSITDGHIYLDTNLMNEGVLPAVNSGLSVSRIGGKVQVPLLRKMGELAGRQIARYAEVKSFETINTEVAEETLRDIRRGKRVTEMFAQESRFNLGSDEQILLMAIATSGRIDQMELEDMLNFKRDILEFYRSNDFSQYKTVSQKGKALEEIDPLIDDMLTQFKEKYTKYKMGIEILGDKEPGK